MSFLFLKDINKGKQSKNQDEKKDLENRNSRKREASSKENVCYSFFVYFYNWKHMIWSQHLQGAYIVIEIFGQSIGLRHSQSFLLLNHCVSLPFLSYRIKMVGPNWIFFTSGPIISEETLAICLANRVFLPQIFVWDKKTWENRFFLWKTL